MDEWINVKDRLPSRGDRVVCNSNKEGVVIASNMNSLGFIEIITTECTSFEYRHKDVTHWMPLPDKPKEN